MLSLNQGIAYIANTCIQLSHLNTPKHTARANTHCRRKNMSMCAYLPVPALSHINRIRSFKCVLNFTLINVRNSKCKDTKRNVKYFKFQQIPKGLKVENRWVQLVKSLLHVCCLCMWKNGNNFGLSTKHSSRTFP